MADTLTHAQRQFVIERLAAFDSATEVAQALQEQFGVEVAPHVVARYDPTQRAGRQCPHFWKGRFLEARRAFIYGPPPPIASRAVRLRRREKMYARALAREDFLLANRILDSIAREVGDDISGIAREVEITDEQRARVLMDFINKHRWKADAQRPPTEEEARAWDRDPIRQFMAMLGPSPKAKRRRNQPAEQSQDTGSAPPQSFADAAGALADRSCARTSDGEAP